MFNHNEFMREKENPEFWERMIEEHDVEFVEQKAKELGNHPCVPIIHEVLKKHKINKQNQIDNKEKRREEREDEAHEIQKKSLIIASETSDEQLLQGRIRIFVAVMAIVFSVWLAIKFYKP